MELARVSQLTDWPTYNYKQLKNELGRPLSKNYFLVLDFTARWWDYDGRFQAKTFNDYVVVDPTKPVLIQIDRLRRYPLELSSQSIKNIMEHRGRMFWACRVRRYIQYTGPDATYLEYIVSQNYNKTDYFDRLNKTKSRFMVDVMTFRSTTRSDHELNKLKLTDELGSAALNSDSPPRGHFLYLLPPTMMGFNIVDKKWSKASRLMTTSF
jgi:hypothetical protein